MNRHKFFALLYSRLGLGRIGLAGEMVLFRRDAISVGDCFLQLRLDEIRKWLVIRQQQHRGPGIIHSSELRFIRIAVKMYLYRRMNEAILDRRHFGSTIAHRDFQAAEDAQEKFLEKFEALCRELPLPDKPYRR